MDSITRIRSIVFLFFLISVFVPCPLTLAQQAGSGEDRVQYQKRGERHYIFEGVQIKGSEEKPQVIYILPWKDIPYQYEEKLEKDFKSEVTEPLTMDDFESEVVLKGKIRAITE